VNAHEVFALAVKACDAAYGQGKLRMDQSASDEEYAAAQQSAMDALRELTDVIYAHFPAPESQEAKP
jgi:hypothetical protein